MPPAVSGCNSRNDDNWDPPQHPPGNQNYLRWRRGPPHGGGGMGSFSRDLLSPGVRAVFVVSPDIWLGQPHFRLIIGPGWHLSER